MTKYREILRLASIEIDQTGIASSCGCARKNILNRAKKLDIAWTLKANITDADLEKLLFLDKYVPSVDCRYPDYEYIDKEMMRNELLSNYSGMNIVKNADRQMKCP